jgi:hypothetical protein
MTTMQHVLLKAATATTTEEGTFEAVISTATPDREGDVVAPQAMVRALQRWTRMQKMVPLAWAHSGDADKQIGFIDPASAREAKGEVVVSGFIDRTIPVGADAWRQVKMGTIGWSYGYLVPRGGSVKRKGGGGEITELDIYEVSACPAP